MKAIISILAGLTLAGCQQSSEPPAQLRAEGEAHLQATAQAHSEDEPTASPIAEPPPSRPVLEQDLAYGEGERSNLVGFLAMPEDAAEPLPGVLVIHEWWGLNDNIKAMTRRLAGEGYIALAVDLYGGNVAQAPDEAQKLMAELMADTDAVRDNLRQAYEYLERYAFSPTIGSIGWCLGGGWSLQTALMLPDALDAMVMYYGRVETDPELLEPLAMPMLGFFGALDQSVPVGDAQSFRNALAQLGKDAEIHIYSDVDHAFANPSGGNYQAEAAEDAWKRTLEFLDAALR